MFVFCLRTFIVFLSCHFNTRRDLDKRVPGTDEFFREIVSDVALANKSLNTFDETQHII